MALKEDDRILLTMFSGKVEIFYGRGDMHDFDIEQDAVQPILKVTLKDEDGNVVSVSSATFTMWKLKSGAVKISAQSMTLETDGTDGKVNYEWSAGNSDTSEPGVFVGRITATKTGGGAQPVMEDVMIRIHRKPGG